MYSNINRDKEYICNLSNFIRRTYQITPVSFAPAKRGYYGETWRLDTTDSSYFIKLVYASAYMDIYECSFPIIQHICDHGINFISRIVKTKSGGLSTRFDGAVLGVFEWIDGDNIQNEQTKFKEYQMLAKVYTVQYEGLALPHESFTTRSADLFFSHLEKLKNNSDKTGAEKILDIFAQNRDKLGYRAKRLTQFSEKCRTDMSHFYITHGDAGGNVIVSCDKFYIVDWDEPTIAPLERDAWFCVHWDWAINEFNDALRQNGIDYTLRPERLAYYCYHMFFAYLNNYIETYFDIGDTNNDTVKALTEYFQCWIEDNIEYADKIKI